MSFPTEDLVPKKETNVWSFLQQNPQYDGRNVRIGILDTGIDPGASGLFNMADGVTPKLVDMVDCTGSGDVDVSYTTTAVWIEDHWEVTGFSGRTLHLSSDWTFADFPNGKKSSKKKKNEADSDDHLVEKDETTTKTAPVRLGIKRAYELFPERLTARVKEDRKRIFQEHMDKYIARVRGELTTCKTKTPEQAKISDDLQAQLDVLTSTDWISDPGPLWDCVVFHDGVDYRVVIDGEETGDLKQCKPMTSFAKERQFETFSVVDKFNYGVNFYNDGNILSIVTDASPHGSHVAGIAAAAEGERSGVAPGAELVSLKIGDSRLGSMETGTSLTRAMIEAVRLKCDIVNLSYGEGCKIPNSGRFIELAEDLVWKHNIVFIAAAGNNGPALTTLGAPGGTTSAIIGVSAYVSPEMMKASYGFVSPTDESHIGTTYTWSSVGPTADGDFGNNITAPGGAITSVSNWCLQKSQLMNGTSMASPHATGCAALLISACKAENIPVTPERIKRAFENTALQLPHLSVVQQGCGIIQVDKALEYLREHKFDATQDVFYAVTVNNNGRGIYLRQMAHTLARQTFSVEIDPRFEREDRVSEDVQQRKLGFEMEFKLEASQPWVTAPDYFMLMNNGRSFNVVVDPTNLDPGLHTAMVTGFATGSEQAEPMFRLPITVTKPHPIERRVELGVLSFEPAEIKRIFVVPPPGATWMDITLRDQREDPDVSSRLFVLHTVQLLPHSAWRDHEKHVSLALLPNQSNVTSIAVEDGVTCEICLARYWSTIGESTIDVLIEFRGVRPVPNCVNIRAGAHGSLLRLHNDLQDEVVNPNASLIKWLTPIRPKTESTASPLSIRDTLPSRERQIYELVLVYEFEQEEKGAFVARAYPLQDVLYESAFESQMMLFFDSDKMYLGASDAYPREITAPKGTVSLRIQIRHDDPVKLSALKEMVVWIERKLDKDISLSVFSTKEDLVKGSGSFKKTTIRTGSSLAMYIAEPPQTKLPSGCKVGDILSGIVTFGGESNSAAGSNKRPGGYAISYFVGPKSKKPSNESDVPEPKDERTPEEKMAEAIRDLKIAHLGKAIKQDEDEEVFTRMFSSIQQEYPDHLPLHVAKLRYTDGDKRRAERLAEVVVDCDEIISRIVEDELALHFGRKIDTDDPKAVKEREDMKEKKSFLIEALVRKSLAYADMQTKDAGEKFDATLQHLKLWADVESSDKYATLFLVREARASRYGSVLKTINKLLTKDAKDDAIRPLSKSELFTRRSEAFEKLGFTLLKEYDRSNRVVAAPKSYMLF
jgi:tripeptidyl-peptidase-2